jgi:tetratricopeptide (TPR) repeat protein
MQYAVSLNPASPEALYNLGNALRAVGRANEAIEAYSTAVRVRPDFLFAHVNLGLRFVKHRASNKPSKPAAQPCAWRRIARMLIPTSAGH